MPVSKTAPIATDGRTDVLVGTWTFNGFGLTPHITLTVGSKTIKLNALAAMRLVMELVKALLEVLPNCGGGLR